jgi:hypothetical protein
LQNSLSEGESKGDKKVLEDTLFSSYFLRQKVLYSSVAELAERGRGSKGDEKVLENTLFSSYFRH